jgi:hypothetical protein
LQLCFKICYYVGPGNPGGNELNGIHRLLAYDDDDDDDVNSLGENIDSIKKNKETITDVSKAVGLGKKTEKTKYMLLSRH